MSNRTPSRARPAPLVFALFAPVSLALPWVGGSWRFSGFALLAAAAQRLSAAGAPAALLLLALPIALLAAALVYGCVKRGAPTRLAVAAFAVSSVCAVALLLSAKALLDASGLLDAPFLVRQAGAGFWLFLALSVIGLVAAMRARKISPGYIVLTAMSVVWLLPIVWIVLTSLRAESGFYTPYFFPKHYTLGNYASLLTDTSTFYYARWFVNTLAVAACTCLVSTCIVLSTSYVLSKVRFAGRRLLLNIFLILGMFPGFMSMIAVYYIIKGLGLGQTLVALVLVYSGGSALGYYVVKGFFDTIPRSIEDAACIDGATKWTVFTRITIPLSKPIIIYTILTSFISPWADFIFARVILGDNYKNYTVALGLYTKLENSFLESWYTRFAAGAVLVSIPIAALFIALQKYYVEGLSGSVKG